MPPGTFFDSSTVVVLTTGSLDRMKELVPESRFDAERFRPNVIIEPVDGASGFVENAWVGRTLCIGDDVRLSITKPCMRCVMVNLGQGDLPPDADILKAAFQHNDGNIGVKAAVLSRGRVESGDTVRLE